jgi:hypothetical protein
MLRKTATLFVAFAFAGCMPTEPFRSQAPRLSTAVEVSPPTMVTGSLVTVTLAVTNHERRPVTLQFGSACQLLYVVHDQHGIPVSDDWACAAVLTELTLQAGETRRQESAWRAARYDYDQHVYLPLPPGPYQIQAYLPGHGYLSQPFVVQLLE